MHKIAIFVPIQGPVEGRKQLHSNSLEEKLGKAEDKEQNGIIEEEESNTRLPYLNQHSKNR